MRQILSFVLPSGCLLQLLLIVVFSNPFIKGQAQEIQQSKELITDKDLNNLIQGRLYIPSYHHIKGEHLLYEFWKLGSVNHLDREYDDLPLWYDLYIDDVILLDWQNQGFGYTRLVKNFIRHFDLNNRRFINLGLSKYRNINIEDGYYEVLIEGNITLLVKRVVVRKEDNYVPFFERNDKVYVIRNEEASLLKNKKSLYNALDAHEKEWMDQFIKKRNIKIRKAKENDWMDIVFHLNKYIDQKADRS